ncbi:claudin-34-like [Rhineura floridana]|uniref:claudin-34-like n=1 Tax=Rhineura floridana TaxID=261503 RepID=UPI002AC82BEF|nr:claudin-34-like [Rhineura floridana]
MTPLPADKGSLVVRLLSRVSCFQLCAFFLAVVGWVVCISSAASIQWRVWHVENIMGSHSGFVGIGIWHVCSVHDTIDKRNILCSPLTEEHESLPTEIAQDLMPLASIVNTLTVYFMSFALYNVFKPGTHKDFIFTFFTIGGVLNLAAGIFVFISVSWNMHSVLVKEGIKLPKMLGLPDVPKEQYVGVSIYLGYVAAASQLLSGSLVLGEACCWRFRETYTLAEVVVHDPENAMKSESHLTCLKCKKCGSNMRDWRSISLMQIGSMPNTPLMWLQDD